MSGGVGPSSDIDLPKEEADRKTMHDYDQNNTKTKNFRPRRTRLSFQQINMLAVVIVLSASGMVSAEDFAFLIFSIVYLYFISKVAFPNLSSSSDPDPPVFAPNNRVLSTYIFAGLVIGLLLPVAYIFEGIIEGDKEGTKAAAPHVFLLASQLFAEGLYSGFSLPIRVFVPIFYNAKRMLAIKDWLSSEIYKTEMENSGSWRRMYVGRGLAFGNLVFWSFNLFGFVLPVYLPKAFKMYYSSHKNKD